MSILRAVFPVLVGLVLTASAFAQESGSNATFTESTAFVRIPELMKKSARARELQRKFTALVDEEKKELAKKRQELGDSAAYKLLEKQAQEKLQKAEKATMEEFQQNIAKIINSVRLERNFQIVFNSKAFLYGSPSLDITDVVMGRYDSDDTSRPLNAGAKRSGEDWTRQGVAYVNLPKLMKTSAKAQALQRKFAALVEEEKKELGKKRQELGDSDTYKRLEKQSREKAQQAEKATMEEFRQGVEKVINGLRLEKNYRLVFNSSALLGGSPSLDITDIVVTKYDSGEELGQPNSGTEISSDNSKFRDVAYMSLPKLMKTSTKAQALQRKFAALIEEEKKELARKGKELGASDAYKSLEKQAQEKLRKAEKTMMEEFQHNVEKIIDAVRSERSYNLVLNSTALLSGAPALDITDIVASKYDSDSSSDWWWR